MSFCMAGMDSLVESGELGIVVHTDHPMILLANTLRWTRLVEIVLPDLKNSGQGFWWRGPRLSLRIHLAIFILQARYQLTDRGVVDSVWHNAAFQLFCGRGIVKNWSVPDHTAVGRFRNRLSPETQRQICIESIGTANELGFADPSWMDIDSTVQEANMAYPSDACLMKKLALMASKIVDHLSQKTRGLLPEGFVVDVASILKTAKDYFFLARNTCIDKKREVFKQFHQLVKREVYPVLELIGSIDNRRLHTFPAHIRRTIDQFSNGKRYLLDVAHFIRTRTIKAGKILSFHAREVACICKGKLGKDNEFGRVFQLGRIGGNFLIPLACHAIRMEDKSSLVPFIKEHIRIFGTGQLNSLGTDKGYYSKSNVAAAAKLGISEIGIQCPGNTKVNSKMQDPELARRLRDRRAGIEPLIGHIKQMGLSRSRMKSDRATLASGYRSVLAFNIRQIERHILGNLGKAA